MTVASSDDQMQTFAIFHPNLIPENLVDRLLRMFEQALQQLAGPERPQTMSDIRCDPEAGVSSRQIVETEGGSAEARLQTIRDLHVKECGE